MKRFFTWLVDKFYDDDDELDLPVRTAAPGVRPKPVQRRRPVPDPVELLDRTSKAKLKMAVLARMYWSATSICAKTPVPTTR